MKALLTIALFIGLLAHAQNYVPKPEDYRIANGKIYNVMLSTNWVTLGGGYNYLEVQTVGPKAILFTVNSMLAYGGFTVTKTFFVYHHPKHDSVTTGQQVESFRCIRVENLNINGVVYEAYDYGYENTPDNRRLHLGVNK